MEESVTVENFIPGTYLLASGPLTLPSLKLVQLERVWAYHYCPEIEGPSMYELCKVGRQELVGEVIWIDGNKVII